MTSLVYFARIGTEGPIKIGSTRGKVEERIAGLQSACPWKILVIGSINGTRAHEIWLHGRFSKTRMKGEWFQPSLQLLTAIDEILSPGFMWPDAEIASSPKIKVPKELKPNPANHPFRAWRRLSNYTIDKIAERVGCAKSHLSQIETKRASPSLDLAERLCALTEGKVTLRDFARHRPGAADPISQSTEA